VISIKRAHVLLRAGANLEAAARADGPTPLSIARTICLEGTAPDDSVAQLVRRAAEPWRPENHHLFPSAARARAVEMLRLGVLLARQPRISNEALIDEWRARVIPGAVQRVFVAETSPAHRGVPLADGRMGDWRRGVGDEAGGGFSLDSIQYIAVRATMTPRSVANRRMVGLYD
jgi:hypothetical protein